MHSATVIPSNLWKLEKNKKKGKQNAINRDTSTGSYIKVGRQVTKM